MRTERYPIDGPWVGRLMIAPRPRGGDWLEDEIVAWRRAGVDVLVSLLTPDEEAELGLIHEAAVSAANGIEWLAFPIPDRDVPASSPAFAHLVTELAARLADGKGALIHCRQGVGRAALLAVCSLVYSGLDSESAIARVGSARGRTVPGRRNSGDGSTSSPPRRPLP